MGFFVSQALAQDAGTVPQKSAALPPEALIMVFMVAIFYLLVIRPQQRSAKVHKEMVGGVKRGDKVVTGGGILGTVTKLEENDVLMVEIASGVVVQVARGTLLSVTPSEKAAERQPKARKGEVTGQVANDN